MCLPVPVLNLPPFLFSHLFIFLGVVQLFDLFLSEFVLLFVELFRRDPLNEYKLVLSELQAGALAAWAHMTMLSSDLSCALLALEPTIEVPVEINHGAEIDKEEADKN